MEKGKQRGCGCVLWTVLLVLLAGGLYEWTISPRDAVAVTGNVLRTLSNGQQVVLSLRQYAQDHDGMYPDASGEGFRSANEVFRELVKDEIASDERIFGAPASKFYPDNNYGMPPGYERTLEANECHWMLLKGQSARSHPKTPIVIENALNASWPPRWDVAQPGWFSSASAVSRERGRSWRGPSIVVGRNDGTVALEKLRPDGTLDWHSPPNLDEHGKSWIDYLMPEQVAKLEYWDVEEKK